MIFARDFLSDQQILGSTNKQKTPLISIILPTYRRCQSGMLERAIRSVLAQDMDDFELIIMDDGSSDGSHELIEQMRAKDDRIIHVRHELNSGLPALRVNEGIELSRGQYIAFQFDDDVWRPNALNSLLKGMRAQSQPSVIIGKSFFTTKVGNSVLPNCEINNITMHEQNRFANNSVLIPRDLFNVYGMYDMHISMRRLCDWDLWLRFLKHVPLVVIDDIVSEVYESNEGAIGRTVPYDLSLFRFVNSIPRDALLTLDHWRDYLLDSLEINGCRIPADIGHRMYEEQVLPFYFRLRHRFPRLEGFSTTLPNEHPKTLLYTNANYDISNEVLVNNFDRLCNRRSSYKSFFQTLKEVRPGWVREADLLMLLRTVEDEGKRILDQALITGVPACYCLDDDLIHFYEYGSKFSYIAPGTPLHNNLEYYLKNVDAVLATNEFIAQSVSEYNPRVVLRDISIPAEYLPEKIRPRSEDRPLRIGYVGSNYRIDEFKAIWNALVKISKEYGNRLTFDFWGLDVSQLPALSSPTTQRGFTFSYFYYLEQLKHAGFDILLTPMFDTPRPRLGKTRIKYYETAVAGALGIFSDVPQYRNLPAGQTCLRTGNTTEEWYQAIKAAIEMPAGKFDRMRERCIADVREEFTVEGQVHNHEASLRAAEFHGKTRHLRYPDGKPRIIYFFHSPYTAGGEVQLWRRLRTARKYGLEPVVALAYGFQDTPAGKSLSTSLAEEGISLEFVDCTYFTEPLSPAQHQREWEQRSLRELMERVKPAIVHSVTFIPTLGQICDEMGIPHVTSLYAVESTFSWPENHQPFRHCSLVTSDSFYYADRWSKLLEVPKFVSRNNAPDELFAVGKQKKWQLLEQTEAQHNQDWKRPRMLMLGAFQERKQQLEIIEAAGYLHQEGFDFHLSLYGYSNFYPEYVEKCRRTIQQYGLEGKVEICEFTSDIAGVLSQSEILLSLSSYESFPTVISDAMAAGVVVVGTPVGGIPELLIDEQTGILCEGVKVDQLVKGMRRALQLGFEERKRVILSAWRVARSEFHITRTANDLFQMYNMAIDLENKGYAPPSVHLLASTQTGNGNVSDSNSPRMLPNSVIKVGKGLTYSIEPQKAGWNGIDIMIGTNMRSAAGIMELKVKTPQGAVIRSCEFNLAEAHDNDWISYRFDPIRNSQGRRFVLELSIRNPKPGTLISIYQVSPPEDRPRRAARWLARRVIRLKGGWLYYRDWYNPSNEGTV